MADNFVQTLQHIWRWHLPVERLGKICVDPSFPLSKDEIKRCGTAILGSLTASLNSAGLLPSSEPPKYEHIALHDLGEMARRIAGEIVKGVDGRSHTHQTCGPGKHILSAANAIQTPTTILTDADLEHLSKRAKETGVGK